MSQLAASEEDLAAPEDDWLRYLASGDQQEESPGPDLSHKGVCALGELVSHCPSLLNLGSNADR